ncbi:MAG TPA: DUF3999 family protein [Candidatus Angelobacter sp.]|nr:DUF3999 family protein [Candidatus Angelobacter sp.]
MKTLTKFLLTAVLAASASIAYFKYQRPVQAAGGGQHYLAIDEAVWQHARADLGDLRLYSARTELPYALTTERGSSRNEHKDVRVLQQSTVGGKTQFIIEMAGVAEYDHVDLKLSTRDFVAHARVEGQDDLHGAHWAGLGESIVYDLSKDNLGSNTMLRLPRSAYKYLRVTIDGPVKPEDVSGASSELREEEKPVWRDVSASQQQENKGKQTILTFSLPENVPVEEVVFDVDPAQRDFRRDVSIENDKDNYLGSGEISRVHMVRSGIKIDSDDHEVRFAEIGQKTIKVIIHNGDDPPLKLNGAHLKQYERRLYFDAPAQPSLTLYYGDEKLDAPIYDYAKLFQKDRNAQPAQFGAESQNASYTGRPDERPWSERHPVLLWAAIIAAVLVLGGIALRSMRAAAA